MSKQAAGNKVQNDLAQAVASGLLPPDAHSRAETLLERLQKPVRLALMGPPASGKSTLLNLLVGQEVLPAHVRLPTLELSFSETEQTVCTLSDGTKTTLPHTDAASIAALSPVFVEMAMPLPALGKISLLEVVAPDDATALHRASLWAAKRADVALWCTRSFNETEQAIWAQMPDTIKDHGFLMVTGSDLLQADGRYDVMMSSIRGVATEEFTQILPIAATSAIAARNPDGTVDKDRLRGSGGLALISAILRQVEMGRQSALDMAEVLLLQHAGLLQALGEPQEGHEEPQVQAVTPPAEPAPILAAAPVTPSPAKVPPVAAAEPEPVAAPAQSKPARSNVVSLHPETREAYEHVLTYIAEQSRSLIELAAELGDDAPAQIMSRTVEYVQWLSDYLNEHGDDMDPALQRARDSAMDAADLVQLMQMEKRDSAAIEGLTLMLQLKHELQADLVA